MLTWPFYLHCLLSVAVAVVLSGLLTQQGMLLAPVAAWVRAWYWRRYDADPDQAAVLKPLGLCPTCFAGQVALWAYVVHYHGPAYHWYEHAYFVALALLFALILQKLLRWSQH